MWTHNVLMLPICLSVPPNIQQLHEALTIEVVICICALGTIFAPFGMIFPPILRQFSVVEILVVIFDKIIFVLHRNRSYQ
ncbi:MAG: hypothetical protein ACPIOQ_13295 [Promethearchaeia archaeon]